MVQRLAILVLVASVMGLGGSARAMADDPVMPPGTPDRVEELERTVDRLARRVQELEAGSRLVPIEVPGSESSGAMAEPPVAMEEGEPTPRWTHGVIYDGGWTLRPHDPERTPYELKFSFHDQLRYTGFLNEEPFVTNAAGDAVPTPPRNDFDINRGRLVFSGYAIDPMLEFYANVDYNTVSPRSMQMLLAWIRHPFSREFNLAYGLGKVPGCWEWQESARFPLGVERSLATTFFRPSISAGVWADGELDWFHYQVFVGDGLNTLNVDPTGLDTHFVYSGIQWWEPWGEFGRGFSDLEDHQEPVLRFGHALTYSRQDANLQGSPGPEQTTVRLSDGTRLNNTGALAPGVTVNAFDFTMYAVHGGWKYRGWSVSGEYFFRWLNRIRADGPIADGEIVDHGFYAQAATFMVPRTVELYGRVSPVFGEHGDGGEVALGGNWYVKQSRDWRVTFDVAYIEDSPTEQERTGYQAGASGVLFRLQTWILF